jgi:hypothetical protein
VISYQGGASIQDPGPPEKELFPPLTEELKASLESFPALVEKTFPLAGRFRAVLNRDVAELSRLLTAGRPERDRFYLSRPNLLSAYLRYFLPWNLYRLCRLLPALPISLAAGDAVLDIGSGPLTLPLALYLSRPDLRDKALEFRCVDGSAAALEAGKKLFRALRGDHSPWLVKTIRGELRRDGRGLLGVPIRGAPAALICALNVFNELFWDLSPAETSSFADFSSEGLAALGSGAVLVVEPGIPRSGEFISLLRSSLAARGRFPRSPCLHHGPCPLPGGRKRDGGKKGWCHFAFSTQEAPAGLRVLSSASRLPKERAVLSFLLAGPPERGIGEKEPGKTLPARLISDAFPLDISRREGLFGRYACCRRGLVLAAGSREQLEKAPPGSLVELRLENRRDPKSGALTGEIVTNISPTGASGG